MTFVRLPSGKGVFVFVFVPWTHLARSSVFPSRSLVPFSVIYCGTSPYVSGGQLIFCDDFDPSLTCHPLDEGPDAPGCHLNNGSHLEARLQCSPSAKRSPSRTSSRPGSSPHRCPWSTTPGPHSCFLTNAHSKLKEPITKLLISHLHDKSMCVEFWTQSKIVWNLISAKVLRVDQGRGVSVGK